jgi:hypothetical protein
MAIGVLEGPLKRSQDRGGAFVCSIGIALMASGCFVEIGDVVQRPESSAPGGDGAPGGGNSDVIQAADGSIPGGDEAPDGGSDAPDGRSEAPDGGGDAPSTPHCVTTSPCIPIPSSCVAAPDCACLEGACPENSTCMSNGNGITMVCSGLICSASAGQPLACSAGAAGLACCL